jgi:hypothetical protein
MGRLLQKSNPRIWQRFRNGVGIEGWRRNLIFSGPASCVVVVRVSLKQGNAPP